MNDNDPLQFLHFSIGKDIGHFFTLLDHMTDRSPRQVELSYILRKKQATH